MEKADKEKLSPKEKKVYNNSIKNTQKILDFFPYYRS